MKAKYFVNLIPIFMGILVFCLLGSVNFLDPTSLKSFHFSDNFTHHFSSVFFRNSPWTFPIGLNPQYGLIDSSTLVYADPIPLMAVIFKILSPWIATSFQYLGLWTLICLIMQGIFGWKLIGLVTPNIKLKTLGTGVFLFTPFLLIRVGMHAALVSQFLILAAIYFCLTRKYKHALFNWILLLGLSASINFYIFFIVFVFWFSDLLDRAYNKEVSIKRVFFEILIGVSVCIITFWQFGYFVGKTESITAGGFGFYQMNLLGPIDPQGWSYLFKKIVPEPLTIEGFAFLGFGVLSMLPFALLKKTDTRSSWKEFLNQYRFFLAALIFFLLLSISNRVLIGKLIFELPLPDLIYKFSGVVRSSGRMFWPIGYLIIFLLITSIIKKYSVKQAQWILTLVLAFQIIDTSAGWLKVRALLSQASNLGNEFQFTHPFWKSAAHRYKNVISIIPQKMFDESWNWIPVARYAAEYKLGTNSAYLARIVPLENRPIQNATWEDQLNRGIYKEDSLYILSDQKMLTAIEHMNPRNDLLAKIDGMTVFAPNYKQCKTCISIPLEMDQYKNIKEILVDQIFLFNRASVYAYPPYLIEGWSYPEAWGTWSNSNKASITLPLPENSNYDLLELKCRAFISNNHKIQRIKIWINGEFKQLTILDKDNNNKIQILIDRKSFKEKHLTLGFVFLDSVSPKTLGLGDDDRQLAIGLTSGIYKQNSNK